MKPNFDQMEWRVTAVKPLENFCLEIFFINGLRKIYDFKPNLSGACFQKLNDVHFFNQAFVGWNTVCWPGNIDIAPEELYYNGMTSSLQDQP